EQFLLQLVTFAENKGTFSIAGFNAANGSTNIVAPGGIGGPGSMAGAIAAVNGVNPSGGTPMGAGLNWVLNPGTGYLVDTSNNRWLLVFSDGAHNSGQSPYDFVSSDNGGSAAQSLDDRNVEVFAVKYGEEGASNVNFTILNDLAADSEDGGHTRQVTPPAGSDLSPLLVAQAIRDAIKTDMIPDLASPSDPQGQITGSGDEVRHDVIITPYDSKAVFSLNWNTAAEGRLHLQLLTSTCELLTQDLVQGSNAPAGVTFSGSDRFQLFTISDDYLRNSDDPANPRYGTWQVIVTGGNMDEGERESYIDDVNVQSRLLLKAEFADASHFAGDAVELLAYLTLDGKPIRDAAVTLEVEAPGQSVDNWLANVAISAQEFQQASDTLDEIGLLQDSSAFDVKAFAARQKSLVFKRLPRKHTLPMSYSEQKRAYTATFSQTTTPGTYGFYVTATGVTEDGVEFRREKGAQAAVRVRPEPDCTILNTTYRRVENLLLADVRFTLCDRFGNAVLVDPALDRAFAIRVDGGQVLKGIANNLDGTYSTSIRYEAEAEPRVSVQLGDTSVVKPRRLVPVGNLDWATEIADFQAGVEGKPGANQFADPKALLDDPTSKPPDRFLALGGGGQVVVGTGNWLLEPQGTDDVTVVVRPDASRHAYAVEALAPDGDRWVLLGESGGETASFGLHRAGLKATKAIRVRDTSRTVRGVDLQPLAAPGAQIQGIGFRRREQRPPAAGLILTCLEDVDEKVAAMLRRAGIETIPELAAADPGRLQVDVPRLALLELISQARLAESIVRGLADFPVQAAGDLTINELLTAEDEWILRRTHLDPRSLALLRQLLMPLILVMKNECISRLTLQELVAGWR
ncbi:MAG TPA: vWA domain-containing protein, partial [Anaerolineae bacterium]|nr:vWA domain-containing protein [Anaerolineae bacterium]